MDRPFYNCVDCGDRFQCAGGIAKSDPDHPQCDSCIEKMLDAVDAEPMTKEKLDRMMRKIRKPRPVEFLAIEDCPHDTNGDGDCGLCCRRGGCKGVCARSACDCPLTFGRYRIWNQPHKYPAYRDYCIACGRTIIEFNQSSDCVKLKFEIIAPEVRN